MFIIKSASFMGSTAASGFCIVGITLFESVKSFAAVILRNASFCVALWFSMFLSWTLFGDICDGCFPVVVFLTFKRNPLAHIIVWEHLSIV